MKLTNLKNEAQKVRMTPEEKAIMQSRLFNVPVESPWVFSFQFVRARALAAMAVLVVFVGSSTAYAAQGTLPGDLLYPVKIHITEPVEVALAKTPEARANVEAGLAKRRVAEAQQLEADGRLDIVVSEEIEKNFDKHAARALALSVIEAHKGERGQRSRQQVEDVATSSVLQAGSSKTDEETVVTAEADAKVNAGGLETSLRAQKRMLLDIKQRAAEHDRQKTIDLDVRLNYDSNNGDDGDERPDDVERSGLIRALID